MTTVERLEIPKPKVKSSEEDMKYGILNVKALNALVFALSLEEFNTIFTCKTAKDIWDTLEVLMKA